MMPRNAELVALLIEAARFADDAAAGDLAEGNTMLAEESLALATRLRTAADALEDAATLVDRVSACKGFDAAIYFEDGAGVWVVTDTNFDDEEYRGATLAEAFGALADAYAARAAQGDTV